MASSRAQDVEDLERLVGDRAEEGRTPTTA
jgi:hypothetical protein